MTLVCLATPWRTSHDLTMSENRGTFRGFGSSQRNACLHGDSNGAWSERQAGTHHQQIQVPDGLGQGAMDCCGACN